MNEPLDFHIRMSELRHRAGLDQRTLAKRLKVDRLTAINWEAGRTFPPYWSLLEIARYFNVDLNWLMGHEVQPQEQAA